MITEKDILADMHTHTIFSKHAYSTLKENIDALKSLEHYEFIAITDHFFGGDTLLERNNVIARLNYCKDKVNDVSGNNTGISVINGAEFNFAHYNQEINNLNKVDWRLIGVHSWFLKIPEITLKELEEEIMFAFSIPYFKEGTSAIAHIERELHKIDGGVYGESLTPEVKKFLDNIVVFAKEQDIYMEVNECSLILNEGGSIERLVYWLSRAKDNGNKISLGTDAHFAYEVGRFDNALQLLNDLDYPKNLILNCDRDKLLELKNR